MITYLSTSGVAKTTFEQLESWQKSQELAKNIYLNFRELKDFSFRDQICRAAVSISNNIAEGKDRYSDKDFVKFLYYSKGSCAEVRSMLYLTMELNYIHEDKFRSMHAECMEISKMIMGLIKALRKSPVNRGEKPK